MKRTQFVLYGLFIGNVLCGLGALAYQRISKPLPAPNGLTLQQSPGILTSDAESHTHLLTYAAVDLIRIKKPYLIVGTDSLEYQTVPFAGIPLHIPAKPAAWQHYWTGILGQSEPGQDAQRWQIAQQRWRAFVQPELDSLAKRTGANRPSQESLLCHALLQKIASNQPQTFYVRNQMLESAPGLKKWSVPKRAIIQVQANPQPDNQSVRSDSLLAFAAVVIGLSGILYTRFAKTEPDRLASLPVDADLQPEASGVATTPVAAEAPPPDEEIEAIKQYIQCFSDRYGDFYQTLEELPEPLTDEQARMRIRQQLVEMALHAQSFVRAALLTKMQRPTGEPNILLITHNWQVRELDSQGYTVFTNDPYQTNKRYRLLRHILADMNLGSLEGVLLHNIYLPAEFLVHS